MRMAMIGLGRMGGNMTLRLLRRGHQVVGYARSAEGRAAVVREGAEEATSLEEAVSMLSAPRVVWVMVPAGDATETTVGKLGELLSPGDTVIDGGNSNWRETVRRAEALRGRGIGFLDCGTSGGISGLENGYCLMVGGEREAFTRAEPLFQALAPDGGYAHVGLSGAGHYVKMVHNGIEYGMLAAYGEGFEILKTAPFELDLATVAGIWRYGSVVRSWLLELLVSAFEEDPGLTGVKGYVEDSGEGRWAVMTAIDQDVPAGVIALSLFSRFASRQEESYAAKVIAALRKQFGGHAVRAAEPSGGPSDPPDPGAIERRDRGHGGQAG